jgi:hypothetical protein
MAIISFIKSLLLINKPSDILAMHIIENFAWSFVAVMKMNDIEKAKQM